MLWPTKGRLALVNASNVALNITAEHRPKSVVNGGIRNGDWLAAGSVTGLAHTASVVLAEFSNDAALPHADLSLTITVPSGTGSGPLSVYLLRPNSAGAYPASASRGELVAVITVDWTGSATIPLTYP